MRLSSSVFVLLAIFCIPTSASAVEFGGAVECELTMRELCWTAKFGRCAHANPRIAIAACTRQLLDRSMSELQTKASQVRMVRAQQYSLRATAHLKLGNVDEALNDYNRAVRTSGSLYWIHLSRGAVLFATGDEQEALESFNDAVGLAPNNSVILNERARLLASALDENVRDGGQAIADARRANELILGWPDYVAVLASAYAENGEFENAAETQQRAIDLLEPGDQFAIDTYLSQLDLYQRGMPFRREFIACETDEDSSNAGNGDDSSVIFLTYLEVYCLADGA